MLPGSYCYDAVAWALENGITNGLADGTFGVNNTCTRGQSVTFLYRAMGTAPTTVNGFTDVAVQRLLRRGCGLGCGERRDQRHVRFHLQPQQRLHPGPDRDLPVPRV